MSWWKNLENNDKATISVALVALVISLWSYQVAKEAHGLALNQEVSRIENYLGEMYFQPAISMHIQKCYQAVLGEAHEDRQNALEEEIMNSIENLNEQMELIATLDRKALKRLETETISLRYTQKLDHYRDIVRMRFQMSPKEVALADKLCIGDVGY